MELQHVNVKLFVAGDLNVAHDKVVEEFHGWVSAQSTGEMLIDVADYLHVPDGPGVVLVGHEADYALDNNAGRWGLLYNRKVATAGTNADRIRQAIAAALTACDRLEARFPELKFDRQRFDLIINDRAPAPNTAENFAAARGEIEAFLRDELGQTEIELTHHSDPRQRFWVSVQLGQPLAP